MKLFDEQGKYPTLRKFIKLGINAFGKKTFIEYVEESYLKPKHALDVQSNLDPKTALEENVLEYWIDSGKLCNVDTIKRHLNKNKVLYEKFVERCKVWFEGDFLIEGQTISEAILLELIVR